MPRVNHVKRAQQDYPNIGVSKGEPYYWWKFRYGGRHLSKTPPRPSQLTQSKMSGALAAMEGLGDQIEQLQDPAEMVDAVDEAISALEDVRDEYQEGIDNMPEALQETSNSAETAREKIEALETCISDLESAKSELEDLSASDYLEDDELEDDAREELEGEGFDDPDEDKIAERVQSMKDAVNEFSDLEGAAQDRMTEAAREIVNAVSLEG